MNKAVLISLLGSVFISTSAFADVQNVTDKFKTVVERVPTTTQICEIVDVPIYGQQGSNTTQDILGGIRSTCTYAGASRLKHLMRCVTFIRCYDTHNRVYENN